MFTRSLIAIAITAGVWGAAPTLAKPPGPSVLGEVTLTGPKPSFFNESIFPLGGDPNIHYGVYLQTYGDIGGDSPEVNAGGYVYFSNIPIKQCGLTSLFGVTQDSQAIVRFRGFCQF